MTNDNDPASRRTVQEPAKKALTIAESVIYANLSRSFLYKKFATGELTRLKAGKRVLIMKSDLDAYLESIREEAS
jgi:excisionase family DNA binding protein